MRNSPRPASLARRALPALAVLGASGALLAQLGGANEVGAQSPAATQPSTTLTTTPKAAAGSSVTTPTRTCTGTTYPGVTSTNKYGVVQVAAVISADKHLCDVQVLAYPSNDRKSLTINERALPTLHTQAIAANGAHIAGVTGATITSRGYEASLQSAIDGAG